MSSEGAARYVTNNEKHSLMSSLKGHVRGFEQHINSKGFWGNESWRLQPLQSLLHKTMEPIYCVQVVKAGFFPVPGVAVFDNTVCDPWKGMITS